jgi:long-chain acyl-CoA synthetase
MLGYFNNEAATRDTFDGEWFRTGDIGHLDSDGFLFISGRKKNLIVLGNGKNVYPEEIENELLRIEYIKEVVVYAEDDAIVAEVFLDIGGAPDCVARLDDDILRINKALPPYKNIGKVRIRDEEFDKTTTKKIKRV